MQRSAIVYAPTRNANFREWSAGAFANYILRGEENTKKSSIRRDSFYIAHGFQAKSYHRTKGDVVRGWKNHDVRWLNSRESRGNKRKKTVKFGAVDHQATTLFHKGIMPLPNWLEVEEAKILARRIEKLFPADCPFLITLHFGKQYDEREEDNLHFHFMFSDRHDFGIGKKVEKLFDSIFDKKTPKGRPVVQDMIEEVERQFYMERGFDVVETGTEESIRRAIERCDRKVEELEDDSSRNKPLKKMYYKDKIKELEEKYVLKKIEEFDREVEEFKKYKELEISGSVKSCREIYKNQVEDSIDKEESVYYDIDDNIIEIDDNRNMLLKSKKDAIKEESRNILLKKKDEVFYDEEVAHNDFDEFFDENYVNDVQVSQSYKRFTFAKFKEERNQRLREEDEDKREFFENERLAGLGSDVLSQIARQGSGFKRPKIVSTLAIQERVKGQYEARKKQKLQMWKENYEKQQVNKHLMSSRQVCLEQTSHSLDDQQTQQVQRTQQTAMSNIDEILNNAQSIKPKSGFKR